MKIKLKKYFYFTLLLFCISCATTENKKIGGVNLYTFRNELAKNPRQVLKQISNIDYKNIEDVGYANVSFTE